MTDDLSAATLPDWLAGAAAPAPSELPLLGDLPDIDDPPAAARTPPPAQTPPPRDPAVPAKWAVDTQEVRHDAADPGNRRTFRFAVRNTSRTEAREYRAEFVLPPGVAPRATHNAVRTPRGLEWALGRIEPGQAVSLAVQLPLDRHSAAYRSAPAVIRVASRPVPQPRLEVGYDAPPCVLAGRPTDIRITVANAGLADAQHVRVAVFGRDAFTALQDQSCGTIPAGESRTLALTVPADGGPARWRVTVSAAGLLPLHSTVEAAVLEPEAAIALKIPEAVGTDEEVTGRLVVTNRTPMPVGGFRAALSLPDELVFRGASRRGVLSERGDAVEWDIGDLAAGAEWSAEVRLVGFSPGRMRLAATTSADGLGPVSATAPLVCEVRRSAGGASLAELLAGLTFEVFDDAEAAAPPVRDARVRHLLFRAAGTRFALPIDNVREVLRPLPVTTVPGVPEWLCGVANVRGDIVTVIDLAALLGVAEPGERRGLVIVRADGTDPLGLLIDEVAGIHPLAADGTPVPDDRLARFLAGVTLDPAGVVHRLNPVELLAAADTPAA